ncbi:hypothetical protein WCD74_02560 [Actinomycetospora sp. OC33-EN08]|uniref:Uncharacterized protein n=1 Tax=Actinomycetospora aurantiaca TaxID=3129233 RepID=A0ABU8MH24_9PSEU
MTNYTVRAMIFKCVDESGVDWTGSDEPYWVFSALDAAGTALKTNRSKTFGDVDTGETKRFKSGPSGAGENIVWPDRGVGAGAPGPIALSIQLWDSDQGDPAKTEATTNAVFQAAALLPPTQWVSAVPAIVREKLIGFIADDMMGSRTILLSQKRLDERLPAKGSFFEQKFRFSGSSGDLPFDVAGGPDYDLTLQVERTS